MRRYLGSFYGLSEGVPFGDAVYRVTHCQDCGLFYQNPVPGETLLNRLYGEWVDSEAHRRAERFPKKWLRATKNTLEIMAIASALPRGKREAHLLDFGMGWGDWCLVARRFGLRVSGCEISPVYLEHAVTRGIPVVRLEELAPSSFDFINTEQVFEHLVAPWDVLQALVAALVPGGLLKISVPNGRGLAGLLTAGDLDRLNAVAPLEHVNCFDHDNLVTFAERSGLALFTSWRLRVMQRLYCLTQQDQGSPADCTYLFFRKPGP